jgi:hypothetical protein
LGVAIAFLLLARLGTLLALLARGLALALLLAGPLAVVLAGRTLGRLTGDLLCRAAGRWLAASRMIG